MTNRDEEQGDQPGGCCLWNHPQQCFSLDTVLMGCSPQLLSLVDILLLAPIPSMETPSWGTAMNSLSLIDNKLCILSFWTMKECSKVHMFCFWPHPSMPRAYYWFCAQGTLLMGSEDHIGCPESNLSWLPIKQAPSAVLSLHPQKTIFKDSFYLIIVYDI